MKAYLITTGIIFALIFVAHIWRILAENRGVATDPFFIILTIVAAALSFWAWCLLRRSTRP